MARPRGAPQVHNMPYAFPVNSPEGKQQLEDAKRRQSYKSVYGNFQHQDNVYLRALCKFSSISTEVKNALKKIDAQLAAAEKERFLDTPYAISVRDDLCEILSEVNRYAKNNLEISTLHSKEAVTKKILSSEDDTLLRTYKVLSDKLKEVSKCLNENMQRAKGRYLSESIRSTCKFLVRNLLIGSVLVALTTLAQPLRGLAYLISCCQPRWKPDSFRYLVMKAWGNKSALARYDLKQTNKEFLKLLKFGMFKWVNGHTRGSKTGELRRKSDLERDSHVEIKKKLLKV
jgi:hypothetical protein